MRILRAFLASAAIILLPFPALAQDAGDLFQAVRNNDLASLKARLNKTNVNARDKRGATLLMQAAAFGSPEAMRLLLDAGADVNARNSFDATALMWAAGDPVKARMLVESGADVNARSKQQRTPLIIAAAHDGSAATVRLLLAKGADVNAKDATGSTAAILCAWAADTEALRLLIEKGADVNAADGMENTPLMNAVSAGNLTAVKLLLAKGAKVNAANRFDLEVKNGRIQLSGFTPLHFAAPFGSPEMIQTLLDAGAKVNTKDCRDMTPLMLAVASETGNVQVVRMLLQAGADVNVKSKMGETALDWALKFNNAAVLAALRGAGAVTVAKFSPPQLKPKTAPLAVTPSLEKSVALLQRTSTEFFKQSGCMGCHNQPVTAMAVGAARAAGVRVDEAAAREQLGMMKYGLDMFAELNLQRVDGPAGADIPVFSLFGMSAAGYQPDGLTDTIVANVAAQQHADGSWSLGGIARAPMEESSIIRTAMAARVLSVFGFPGRKAEFDQRIDRARAWLLASKPKTTDDFAMRLLGLTWTAVDRDKVQKAAQALKALQRADGGWSQNPNLTSDAYATGESLYALHESGALRASDAGYQRGVRFLLNTQFEDGSWYVRSRAPKFQPYFQSGFPYDHDQWISSGATAWASMAPAAAAGQDQRAMVR